LDILFIMISEGHFYRLASLSGPIHHSLRFVTLPPLVHCCQDTQGYLRLVHDAKLFHYALGFFYALRTVCNHRRSESNTTPRYCLTTRAVSSLEILKKHSWRCQVNSLSCVLTWVPVVGLWYFFSLDKEQQHTHPRRWPCWIVFPPWLLRPEFPAQITPLTSLCTRSIALSLNSLARQHKDSIFPRLLHWTKRVMAPIRTRLE
jgi:hypothetical protein